jgi:hypothetical protein
MKAKVTTKGKESGKEMVEVVADGTNRISLMFPKTSKLKCKGKISQAAVLELLKGLEGEEGEVSGQCDGECRLSWAVGGVRG